MRPNVYVAMLCPAFTLVLHRGLAASSHFRANDGALRQSQVLAGMKSKAKIT